jgi:DnaJ-domain-containing protein 1
MPDAFDVLGIEPNFTLDLADLERQQRTLLATIHPNRSCGANAVEDRTFDAQGEINDAARQLRDPVARAELLLKRAGQPLRAVQSPELLERVFEWREALEQAIRRRDAAALSNYVDAAHTRHHELVSVLEAHFASGKVQACGESAFEVALQELNYLKKIIQRGEQGLDDIE